MTECPLVVFTLLTQMAVGVFWALSGVSWVVGPEADAWVRGPMVTVVGPLVLAAVATAFLHLGRPGNARRALANLGGSWLSREILLAVLFGVGWVVVVLWPASGSPVHTVVTMATALAGAGLVYAMARVYRLRTVPVWDTSLTTLAFFVAAVSLGGLGGALVTAPVGGRAVLAAPWTGTALRVLVQAGLVGLVLELALERPWRRRRRYAAGRVDPGLNPAAFPTGADGGRASSDVWRPALLVVAAGLSLAAWVVATDPGNAWLYTTVVALAFAAALAAGTLGRVRFYGSYARQGV